MGREKGEALLESSQAVWAPILAMNQQFAVLAFKQIAFDLGGSDVHHGEPDARRVGRASIKARARHDDEFGRRSVEAFRFGGQDRSKRGQARPYPRQRKREAAPQAVQITAIQGAWPPFSTSCQRRDSRECPPLKCFPALRLLQDLHCAVVSTR
jgi:hypothetical protein